MCIEEIVLEINFEVVIRFILGYIRFGGKKKSGSHDSEIVCLMLVGHTSIHHLNFQLDSI